MLRVFKLQDMVKILADFLIDWLKDDSSPCPHPKSMLNILNWIFLFKNNEKNPSKQSQKSVYFVVALLY